MVNRNRMSTDGGRDPRMRVTSESWKSQGNGFSQSLQKTRPANTKILGLLILTFRAWVNASVMV